MRNVKTIKTSLIEKVRAAAEEKSREHENAVRFIDRSDREWSAVFIKKIAGCERGIENIRAFLREKKFSAPLYEEFPYRIYTYEDMDMSDPSQKICGENEIVLSCEWVGYEKEMQVLTFAEFEAAAEEVINDK